MYFRIPLFKLSDASGRDLGLTEYVVPLAS